MNQSKRCHRIANFKHLYVDGFKAFKNETRNPEASFILSHYHSDHYVGLPTDKGYQGPAKIHCSMVTAELLIEVHGVPKEFVVGHAYGETWVHTSCTEQHQVEITFYDANHCPGASIILARERLKGGDSSNREFYVHTGDFRYHPRMKDYPLLLEAVRERNIHSVYLDTTYSSPKHIFMPQQDAVDMIASQVETLLVSHNSKDTLVLLSCYSIGKEKILIESSKRSKQRIYVNKKKYKLLECADTYFSTDENPTIMNSITLDDSSSKLHVVQMGLAGKMFPYFTPNFEGLYSYVSKYKNRFRKVVAFIPTGFASLAYNQSHAIHQKIIRNSG